jgi:hypothetical protein
MTYSANLSFFATKTSDTGAINSGIDGVPIGANTASTGKFTSVTNTGLTSGRIPYVSTGGLLVDSANLTFNGTNLGVQISRTSSTNGIALTLSDDVTGAQTSGVYKSIRSTSNGGVSVSEMRFLEIDGTNNNTGLAFATAPTAGGLTERMRIDNNGNVGIGTTTMNRRLNIAAGTAAGIQFQATGTSGRNYSLFATDSGAAVVGALAIYDDTAGAYRVVLNEQGYLGIGGNTSPLARLDILGNTNSYDGMAKIYLTDVNSNASSRNWSIGNGGSAYGSLTFSVSAAKDGNAGDVTSAVRMVITSGGNVGIGTVGPLYKLDVNSGSANGSGIVTILNLKNPGENYGDGAKLLFTAGASTTGGCAIGSYGTALNAADMVFYAGGNTEKLRLTATTLYTAAGVSVGIGASDPNYQLHVTTSFAVGLTGFNQQLSFTNDTIQSLLLGTGYTALKLNPLGGNVGIGTSSPDSFTIFPSKLVVGSGTGNQQITVYSGTSSEGNIIFADGTSGSQQYMGLLRYDHADNAMKFYVNGGTDAIRIKSDGYVGIGVGNPTSPLTVSGGISSINGAINVAGYGGFYNGASKFGLDFAGNSRLYSSGANSSTKGGFEFHTTDSTGALDTIAMFLNGNGQLGVGTTMGGILGTTPGIFINGVTANQPDVQSLLVTGAKIGFAGISSLIQNQLCVYDSTAGNGAGTGGAIVFGGNAGSGQGTFYCTIESSKDNGTAGDYGASLRFYTRPSGSYYTSPNMTITSGGSVGIGTISPSAPLTVKGLISSTSTPVLYLQQGGSSPNYGYRFNIDNVTTGNLYLNRLDGNTNTDIGSLITIRPDGNLGIGIFNPTNKLAVYQYETTTGAISITGSTWVSIDMLNANADTNARNWKIATTQNSFGLFELISSTVAGGALNTTCLSLYQGKSLALEGATTKTGTGITFPSSQSASSDANTLDDYEEGTWTPTLTFGGGTTGITYVSSYNTAFYTKIGSRVFISGITLLSSKGSSTGNAYLTSLPFPADGVRAFSAVASALGGITFTGQYAMELDANQDVVYFYQTTTLGVQTNLTNTNFSDTSFFTFNFSYYTAS